MNKQTLIAAREVIGQHLKERREEKGITTYQMEKMGVRHETLKAIESGQTNYSIDGFLSYIHAIDCYFYLADKDGKHLDFQDLADKGIQNDPY